jgi:hypothetical protein
MRIGAARVTVVYVSEGKVMSRWNHRLCLLCYGSREPGRAPHHVTDEPPGTCCDCGLESPTVWYRDDPKHYKYCGLAHGGDDAA